MAKQTEASAPAPAKTEASVPPPALTADEKIATLEERVARLEAFVASVCADVLSDKPETVMQRVLNKAARHARSAIVGGMRGTI